MIDLLPECVLIVTTLILSELEGSTLPPVEHHEGDLGTSAQTGNKQEATRDECDSVRDAQGVRSHFLASLTSVCRMCTPVQMNLLWNRGTKNSVTSAHAQGAGQAMDKQR